jgi:hypothetical protein
VSKDRRLLAPLGIVNAVDSPALLAILNDIGNDNRLRMASEIIFRDIGGKRRERSFRRYIRAM